MHTLNASRVSPSQTLFFQLYKKKDNKEAEKRIRTVEALGYKAIFLTVDAPFPGNRERDVQALWETEDIERLAAGDKVKADLPRKRSDMEEVEEAVAQQILFKLTGLNGPSEVLTPVCRLLTFLT